jgi:hypothetical protein
MVSGSRHYDLETELREGYLYAWLRAEAVTPALAHQINAEIGRRLRDAGTGRLMIESEIDHAADEPEIFRIMSDLIEIMPRFRIAFVNKDTDQQQAMQFAVGIASHTGEDYRHFESVRAAEDWLFSWE